ncbi:Peroxidase 12 [Hordeum vulgare]|nr:Peroxidase 12 [Hordeum vulgare]
MGGEPKEEEEPVQMPVRTPEADRPSWQIDLDSVEDDDDPQPRTPMDKKMKASHSTRRSLRLNGTVSQPLSLTASVIMGSPSAANSSSSVMGALTLTAPLPSPAASSIPAPFASLITARLTNTNYLMWKAQILPPLHISNAVGYVDGSSPAPGQLLHADEKGVQAPNPAYADWFRQDQIVLSYLMASLTDDVLQQLPARQSPREWTPISRISAARPGLLHLLRPRLVQNYRRILWFPLQLLQLHLHRPCIK